MTRLDVRTPDQPLARITVTGARLDVVASGSGELAVDAPPGVYEVSATAAGREARLVKVGDEAVTIQLDPPRPVTATPDAGSPHHVDAVGEVSRWPSWEPPAASRIVVVVRLPAGAPTERVVTRFELRTGAGDHLLDVVLAGSSPEGLLVRTAAVPAGSYVLTDLHPPCAGLVVPAWPGWQTVVFLASAGDDVSSALAVMHNVPVDGSWQPDRLADLTDQLHWALTARPTVDLPGLRRIEAAALSAAGPAGVPPIVSLLLARLAIVAGDESAARRHHDELVRHESADPVIPADLDALGGVAVTTGFPPLLARSADDLLGLEARRPGSIVGPAAAFAARLASPLWFRWSATWAADSPIAAPSAFDARGWERAAATLVRARPSVRELEDRRALARLDPATFRLLSYVIDACHIRGVEPADVLEGSDVSSLVTATGLPAVALTAAVPVLAPRPRPWKRWLRRGAIAVAVAVVAVAVAIWILGPDDGGLDAVDDRATATPGASIVIDVLANDSTDDGDVLAVVRVGRPSMGRAELVAGGVRYVAAPTASGIDTFTYDVTDSAGRSATATVVVDVGSTATTTASTTATTAGPTVVPTTTPADNRPPTAADDVARGPEDEPLTIEVLANDTDPDGDELRLVEIRPPVRGTARIADGGIEYTPDADLNGVDTFSYVVGDGAGGTDEAAVTVQVEPVNDPPLATDDVAFVVEGGQVPVVVLANDTDVDGDQLTAGLLDPPSPGKVALVADGTFEYLSAGPTSAGTDAFTYVVNDGVVDSAPATVAVTILPELQVDDPTTGEAAQPTLTVKLRVETTVRVEVDFVTTTTGADDATAGADFAVTSGTLVFEPGVSVIDHPLNVVMDDVEPEGTETFTVQLTGRYEGGITVAVESIVTIVDDDVE